MRPEWPNGKVANQCMKIIKHVSDPWTTLCRAALINPTGGLNYTDSSISLSLSSCLVLPCEVFPRSTVTLDSGRSCMAGGCLWKVGGRSRQPTLQGLPTLRGASQHVFSIRVHASSPNLPNSGRFRTCAFLVHLPCSPCANERIRFYQLF